MEGQIGLGDVMLWGRVLALLGVQGVGRLGQASAVALQSLRGQWGSTLTSIRRWRDATSVSHEGAVREEGPRLWWHWWELASTSSWGAGVGDRGDGALTQGTSTLHHREK